jgi:hypothetical protein
MFTRRITLALAALALVASLFALGLGVLQDEISKWCLSVSCLLEPRPDYLQLAASGLAAVATLGIVASLADAPGPDLSQTAVQPPLKGEPVSSKADLENGPWIGLVEDCVALIGEFDRHQSSFDLQCKEIVDHTVLRLEEVLVRSGVEIISDDVAFDRDRHKPDIGDSAAGDIIAETISPGFAVEQRVLRRALVRLNR